MRDDDGLRCALRLARAVDYVDVLQHHDRRVDADGGQRFGRRLRHCRSTERSQERNQCGKTELFQ